MASNACLSIYYIFLLLTAYHIIVTLSVYKSIPETPTPATPEKKHEYVRDADVELSKTIWASHRHEENITCHIPHVDPYHPSITYLNQQPKPIKCENRYPLLFKSTLDSTLVPMKTLQEFEKVGINGPCCYHVVQRKETKEKPDDGYTFSKACYPISLTANTTVRKQAEFIAIRCSLIKKVLANLETNQSTENTAIVDMHAFVPVKPNVEKRIADIFTKKGRNRNVDTLNVVILGIDSLSHMSFIRDMPKTYAYLMDRLKAVEMNGYNKIGVNTFPNLVAALTGLSAMHEKASCEINKTFDNCPMIWKKFSQNGYRTVYGEDATNIGNFNNHKTGFRNVPTDYYLRPFGRAADELIGYYKAFVVNQCYGPRLQFKVILNYMKKLAYAMGPNKRYFQFLWSTSLTHDYLNDGKIGDLDLMLTLQWLQTKGYFDNTAFILMSDHGIRNGRILDYPAGKLEWNIPALFFVFPPWFRADYKDAFDNLIINSARLTTPYDLHETLNDLVNLNGLTSQTISQRQMELDAAVKNGSVPRDISLFLSVPPTRTCSMAGVDINFCICHRTTAIHVGNWNVIAATRFAVEYINSLLLTHVQCAVLELDKIKSAQWGKNDEVTKDVYHVSFDLKPSGGSFDASLVHEGEGWTLSGTIVRTNLYGNQSHCVADKGLKLYCYCVDLL